jgi:alkanesulfonate monooxygenase SsuD/methylene tetrahydromethanopterin reductase-like flavin-dependent oxidoreductase (luciferase family)
MRPKLGVLVGPKEPVAELPRTVRAAEAAGYDELWLAEDCFLHGGLTAAATALALTERITVGAGLLPAAVRNPAIAAMEIATLALLHPGRVQIAFGHGVEAWMLQIAARPPDRLVLLEEVVRAVRALLHDETVDVAGTYVTLENVRLEQPPATPPELLIGTTGKRGIAIAARAADGLVVAEGASEAALRWARGELGAGGRLVAYSWLRIEDDAASAREALWPAVARWRDGALYGGMIERAGTLDGPESPALHELAVTGTAEDCAAAVRRRAEAGADAVVLVPAGPDPAAQAARFAAEVLPRLA